MLSIATANRRRPSRISLWFDFWSSMAASRNTPSASAIRPISSLRSRPGTSIDVSPAASPLIAPRAGFGLGARFLDFHRWDPEPAACWEGGRTWKFCIRIAPDLMCIRTWWWRACAHVVDGTIKREVRTVKTTTKALLDLSQWLASEGCTHIVMEATGVYWKPVWHILEDGDFDLALANAADVKTVPGRKTDVNDATWLADLLAHGLVRGSFVPNAQTQEMRGLLRTRKQLVRERTSHIQRLQKTLEDANIKLDGVISDIIGLSGRRMIEALIAGESDP